MLVKRWREHGSSGSWTDFPDDHVVIRYSRKLKGDADEAHGRAYFKMPTAAETLLKAGKDVDVEYSWYKGDGPYCGESFGGSHPNWLLLSMEYDTDENIDTIIHETGHAVKMCISPGIDVPDFPVPTGKTKLDEIRMWHDKWYAKLGNHCGETGASGEMASRANPASKGWNVAQASRCVMHGNGGKVAGSTYCDKCGVVLMAATIKSVAS